MLPGPCKVDGIDCPNRSLTCRKECKYWAQYQDELARIREARSEYKHTLYGFWEIRNRNKPQSKKGAPTYHVY